MFVNRVSELNTLENEYNRDRSSFTVIYGRRRTGKTTLIKKFMKSKLSIYYFAEYESEINMVRRMKRSMARFLNDPLLEKLDINDWDILFEYFINKIDYNQKIVFVIDEFQNLVKSNTYFTSKFQRIWDEHMSNKNIMLILCGSLIGMMYKHTLAYNSPLYGRRTSQILLKQIPFSYYKEFFPNDNFENLLKKYSITGGIPKYINFLSSEESIAENFEAIIDKDNFLYDEPKFILNEEISDHKTYFTLLEIIAKGERKSGKIASKLGIQASHVSSYLNKLRELDIIEREVPITEKNPEKSRNGLYKIRDNFFMFWFRFIYPHTSLLEIEEKKYVISLFEDTFEYFVSNIFEDVCRASLYQLENIPFQLLKIGRWWDKDTEIDVVGIGEENIVFGECKWSNKKIGMNILQNLKEKSKKVKWKNKTRDEVYTLFSKAGFSDELIEKAKNDESIILYEGEEII